MGHLGTWIGTSRGNSRVATTIQAVIYGKITPRPAVLLIDSKPGLHELQCELAWPQAKQLAASLCAAHRKFGANPKSSGT